jgi:hypothetical protein
MSRAGIYARHEHPARFYKVDVRAEIMTEVREFDYACRRGSRIQIHSAERPCDIWRFCRHQNNVKTVSISRYASSVERVYMWW